MFPLAFGVVLSLCCPVVSFSWLSGWVCPLSFGLCRPLAVGLCLCPLAVSVSLGCVCVALAVGLCLSLGCWAVSVHVCPLAVGLCLSLGCRVLSASLGCVPWLCLCHLGCPAESLFRLLGCICPCLSLGCSAVSVPWLSAVVCSVCLCRVPVFASPQLSDAVPLSAVGLSLSWSASWHMSYEWCAGIVCEL